MLVHTDALPGAVSDYCHSRKEKQKGIELQALLFGVLKVPGSNVGRSLHHPDKIFVVFCGKMPGFRLTQDAANSFQAHLALLPTKNPYI
jgi:hypothetical protein